MSRTIRPRRPARLARTSRLLSAFALVPALALGLAACGDDGDDAGGEAASPTSGGTLTIALSSDPVSIYPRAVSPIVRDVARPVVDSLLALDPKTRQPVPWLAEKYEANADATEYTFRLRAGVTFSDGTPLTAEVVKRNFDDILANAAKSTGSAALSTLKTSGYTGTDAVDELTVVQHFGAAFPAWPVALANTGFGILAPATLDLPYEQRFNKVVGSGPFVLTSYTKNSEVVLSRRDGYRWAPRYRSRTGDAYLDKVVYRIIAEPSVRAGALQNGQVQVSTSLNPADIEAAGSAGATVITQPLPRNTEALVVTGADRTPLNELPVRQAIVRAVDTGAIRDSLLHPSFKLPTSVLTSTVIGWADQSAHLKTDVDEANRLLDGAGWRRGGDGGIREKDGRKLTVVFGWIDRGNPWDQGLVELLKAQLTEVGIDLQPRLDTAAAAVEALGKHDQYDLFLAGVAGGVDPDNGLRGSFANAAPNIYNVQDTALQPLLQQQAVTTDPDKRAGILADVQERIAEQGLAVPLVEDTAVVGVGADVHDFALDFDSRIPPLFDVWVS
ncbi:ABC transporter substrate-binding protein [Parafrankia soli]|uniref:ABC transporter substrate-binding protein n=1 Tax=Parafrankia soli TaxID=2599596 RepID=A0A1S1PVS5_9ACTN|nr:ABC transporter substrate-binding protein [Parafrankia soli]OHV25416.1 ABC transporter substrate-binding protein [Parafrankia soli]